MSRKSLKFVIRLSRAPFVARVLRELRPKDHTKQKLGLVYVCVWRLSRTRWNHQASLMGNGTERNMSMRHREEAGCGLPWRRALGAATGKAAEMLHIWVTIG